MRREKGQYARVQVGYPVMVKSSRGIMVGQVKEIGPSGVFLCCQWFLEPQEVIKMTIKFSPLSRPVKATGEVIQSNIYCLDDENKCHGIGVQFTKISDKDRRLIATRISESLKSDYA